MNTVNIKTSRQTDPIKIDTATLDYLRHLANELNSAKHGQKTALVAKASAFLNCSTKQVYALLKQTGLTPSTKTGNRKTRTDKGTTAITKEQAELIGGMILVATRANGKRILSVKDATHILKAQGKLPDVDVSTILRALRQYHCHPDQLAVPTAHTTQRSLHPNHTWQIDASVCVLFYLPKGGLAVMEEKEFYKNKPKNLAKIASERVIRYVITDHYSGAIYCEYVLGAESSENLTHVFMNAIAKRSPTDPMRGVPLYLGMDKGSANMSGLFLNFLERLSVTPIIHATGNSRAKGSVEKANDIVETKFESRLAFLDVKSLDELNTLATNWRTHFNETEKHTRHGNTRNRVWLSITREQLRVAPSREICQELVTTRPKSMKVRGDLTVTHTVKGFGNQRYDLTHLPNIYPKADVDIVVNPYRVPNIDVMWQGVVYTVCPVATDEAGFDITAPVIGETIIAKPQGQADQNRKTMLKQAYNADTEADVDKARKAKTPAYLGQIDINADIKPDAVPLRISKAGTDIDVSDYQHLTAKRELKPLTHVETAKQLKAKLGDTWTGEHYAWLVNTYPNGVAPTEIDSISDKILNHHTTDDTLPKVVNY